MTWPWRDERIVPAEDKGLRVKAPADAFRQASEAPPRRRLNAFLYGRLPEPAPAHFGPVEKPEAGKVGICCSGGGIRSAAFSLGALQQLQAEDELRRASYLAAVSGGSYIAAALSMVADIGGGSEKKLLDRMGPFEPGSPEEQYLRNRCSYLAPTFADKVSIGLRLVLGLMVNLVYLALPLAGLALVLVGLFYAPSLPALAACTPDRACDATIPTAFWIAPVACLALGIALALINALTRLGDLTVRFLTTWSVRMLVLSACLALLLVAVPLLVELVRDSETAAGGVDFDGFAAPLIGGGTLTLVVGAVAQVGHLLRSEDGDGEPSALRKALGRAAKAARLAVTYLAGMLVGPALFFIVFVRVVAVGMAEVQRPGEADVAILAVGLAVLGVSALLYWLGDMTSISLHPYYKRRLSSAFALKRVSEANLGDEERERVEARPTSEPSEDVGVAVERNYDDLVPLSMASLKGGAGGTWPTLIVCAAANISDKGATPPGRGVTSFTFSAGSVGGPLVGAVRTWEMESGFEAMGDVFPDEGPAPRGESDGGAARRLRSRSLHKRRCDLTLPAVMAMSGAAISPSMGKMTRPPLRFLMALANVRLGVWVPNPRFVGLYEQDRRRAGRYVRPRPSYLFFELFGINTIGRKYLYVTDGGHYENLGLVELLRRGCTEIYCLDASGVGRNDGEFEALGEAIALARSELGVEIEFDPEREEADPETMVPGEDGLAKRDVIVGKITYRGEGDEDPVEGRLVYARNTMTEEARWDVRAHHRSDPRFPNNPTVDQLYTDQKFEAYRALGAGAGRRAVELMKS